MSDFPPIDELIEALKEHADPRVRAKAARLIGEMAHTLDGNDRESAKQALNRAMLDADPSVLMSAMSALGQIPALVDEDEDEMEDDSAPVKAESCAVCGKPMALVDGSSCEFDACPYR